MGQRGRALTLSRFARALARAATAGLLALALGSMPGAPLRAIIFERPVPSLPPGASRDAGVRVLVAAIDGHRPVGRARVRVLSLVDERAFLAATVETDASGRVAISGLPRGPAWVLVDARGYARTSVRLDVGAPHVATEVDLPAEHRLDVTVVDDLGKPVAAAEVEVASTDPLPVGIRVGTDGRGEVPGLAAGPWSVTVRAPGFEDFVRRDVHEGAAVKLVLRKLGALVVRVVDPQGAPAPLAHVQVAGGDLWPSRTTDTSVDGTVRIGGLSAGAYALRATSGSLVSATEVGLPLARGGVVQVELSLRPGAFAVAKVVDGEEVDAAPVAHARVTLAEAGISPFPLEATSDAAGMVRLGPYARGPALLTAQAEGFVPRRAVEAPEDGHAVVLVLVRAGEVEGRVVDGRGRPIDGATIELVGTSLSGAPIDDDPRRESFRRLEFDAALAGPRPLIPAGELGVVPGPVPGIPRARIPGLDLPSGVSALAERWVSRGDGSFRATPASPGRIRVVARHPEFLEGLSDVLTLLPGQSAHVDLVLRGGGKLDGRVVDAAGRPVAGAFVTMAAVHGLAERDVRSATDGTFAFAAVPEDVVVSASVGEDDDARGVRTGASVREGGHESVTLVIPDARRPLDVHVEDERGFPLGAAQVSAASVDPADPYRTTVFTDGHGDAVLRGGQGLSLRVEVSAPGHATRAVPIAQDAASTRVVLAAAETIAGLVRESRSGQPVARAEVVLLTDGRVRRTETDGRGAFRFSDVALGRARLRLRADGRVASERDVDVSATATRTHDVGPIDLQDEAAVEGTVLDAAGKPVVGARVARDVVPTFVPVGPRDPSIAVTDGRGRFRLGGLPEGAVSLEAYAPESGRVVVEGVLVSSGRTTGGVTLRLTNDGDPPTPEPLSSGGVAVTLGELAGEGHEVVVVAVAAASEAERAGLAPGDVLVAVDGERVRRMADARARLSGPLSNDVIVLRRRAEVTEALRISRERVRR